MMLIKNTYQEEFGFILFNFTLVEGKNTVETRLKKNMRSPVRIIIQNGHLTCSLVVAAAF